MCRQAITQPHSSRGTDPAHAPPGRAKLHLQVARPVVAKPGHVPGKPGNEVDVLRVGPQVDQEPAPLGRTDAGEVPQPLIRPVLLALHAVHAVPEAEQRLVDRLPQLGYRRALNFGGRPGGHLSIRPPEYRCPATDGCHGLKAEEVVAEESVADQVDRPSVLAYRVPSLSAVATVYRTWGGGVVIVGAPYPDGAGPVRRGRTVRTAGSRRASPMRVRPVRQADLMQRYPHL